MYKVIVTTIICPFSLKEKKRSSSTHLTTFSTLSRVEHIFLLAVCFVIIFILRHTLSLSIGCSLSFFLSFFTSAASLENVNVEHCRCRHRSCRSAWMYEKRELTNSRLLTRSVVRLSYARMPDRHLHFSLMFVFCLNGKDLQE
jgi:hypothetical protein